MKAVHAAGKPTIVVLVDGGRGSALDRPACPATRGLAARRAGGGASPNSSATSIPAEGCR